jgi:ectoine hydroxylase
MNGLIQWVRRLKISYTLYNFFNQSKLRHNKEGYKKYNIRRPVFLPVTSDMFQNIHHNPADWPWLDQVSGVDELRSIKQFEMLDAQHKEWAEHWVKNGYLILPGLFENQEADLINGTIQQLLDSGKVSFRYGNKVMFANKVSKVIQEASSKQELISVMEFLLGTKIIPFQTINFITGSEQKAHSDSVHMTTYPPGYLIAAWIALEDIGEGQGALFYYPGSHRFDYLMKDKFTSGDSPWLLGENAYKNYENAVEILISEKYIQPVPFHAKKGDVLIWHANLLHGGSAITQKGSTRKSMVVHCFGSQAIKYHEITGRPALIDQT